MYGSATKSRCKGGRAWGLGGAAGDGGGGERTALVPVHPCFLHEDTPLLAPLIRPPSPPLLPVKVMTGEPKELPLKVPSKDWPSHT